LSAKKNYHKKIDYKLDWGVGHNHKSYSNNAIFYNLFSINILFFLTRKQKICIKRGKRRFFQKLITPFLKFKEGNLYGACAGVRSD
jgi:hypothetical protein